MNLSELEELTGLIPALSDDINTIKRVLSDLQQESRWLSVESLCSRFDLSRPVVSQIVNDPRSNVRCMNAHVSPLSPRKLRRFFSDDFERFLFNGGYKPEDSMNNVPNLKKSKSTKKQS